MFYEYLSSGFKSIISILFGIIKDIELRFKEPYCNAKDFDGIILIDEVELHLHPEWQEKASSILKKVFP
ncbi:AAA family ATPase, partial [Acinetobacter variabilis]